MKRNYSILILLFCSISLFAQLPAKKYQLKSIPEKFDTYQKASFIETLNDDYNNVNLVDFLKPTSSNSAWEVYSDRNNNKSYYSANNNSEPKHSDLSHMQKFYVKDVQNSYVNIVDIEVIKGTKFETIDYGWIHAKYLVLSRFSLLSANGAPKKGMILTSISDIEITDDEITRLLMEKNYFTHPDLKEKNRHDNYASKFNFLFILKETPSAYLLSRSDEIKSSDLGIKNDVRGWIPKSKVTAWDHRVCLEPWYGREAAEEYENKTLYVLRTQENLKDYINSGFSLKLDRWALKKTKIKQKRQLATQMRMPVLEWKESNSLQKKVAAIAQMQSDLKSASGDTCSIECQIAKIKNQITEVKRLQDNVDVLIVMDGTNSMSDYADPIIKSIKTIMEKRKVSNSKQKIRWGLAVYRDYSDANESRDIEVFPFSKNEKSIIKHLEEINFKTKNSEHAESHYHGMVKGIERIGFKEGNSNMVILVGDAGNHRNDIKGYTRSSVTELLSAKKINLISFQVNYLKNSAYAKFNSDARGYLLETSKIRLSRANYKQNVKSRLTQFGSDNYSQRLSFTGLDRKFWPLFGAFKFSVEGSGLNVRDFEYNFTKLFIEYMHNLDHQREILKNAMGKFRGDGIIFPKDTNNEEFEDIDEMLREKGFNEKQIALLKRQGQLSVHGYVHTRIGEKPSAYRPVMFISKSFKERVIDRQLDKIAGFNGSIPKARKHLYSTFITLIQGMVGETTPEKVIKNKTFDQVWKILLGVDFDRNSILRNVAIKDLKTGKIDDDDIKEFFEVFKSDVRRFLKKPYDDKYTLFEAAEQEYLWIPLNDVPGCGSNE